ncbi:MAG: hypothetical protein LBP23_07105 [Treponema sp.]|jgi:hypothetical protein|nr:hypothetical protein [Treponema sp.]
MLQKNIHKNAFPVTTFMAVICILVYIAALVFAAVRITANCMERRIVAESEFFSLADRASSSAVALGFMNEPFNAAMEDAVASSLTLQGVIVTGPGGEHAWERERGAAITWTNNSPRFKSRFDLMREPFYMPLRIEGLRNVNIQAVAGSIDYEYAIGILKQSLFIVLAGLTLAFFTLLLDSLMKSRRSYAREAGFSAGLQTGSGFTMEEPGRERGAGFTTEEAAAGEPRFGAGPEYGATEPEPPPERPAAPMAKQTAPAAAGAEFSPGDPGPKGLFSPRGNIGWEEYTNERLAAELHRCASFEQDLAFIVMEFRGLDRIDDRFYRQFAEDSVNFFTLRDLIFERGERGISIIYPNVDLETGFAKSEEFHNRVLSKYSPVFKSKTDLCIGLSSRSGRLVDAERIVFEAAEALAKALEDPVSHIVAFKSNPEKYRDFIASQNKRHP